MNFTLDFLFSAHRQRDEVVAPHSHRCYEIVYYGSGEGLTRIGGREWTFASGQYAVIRPSTIHDEERAAATDVICMGFSPGTLRHPLPEGVFGDAEDRPLQSLLAAMLGEMQEQRPRSGEMLELLARQLLIGLERKHSSGSADGDGEDKFRYTLGFMREHFTQRIDFGALASLAGYSYDRYRHLFKQKTGCSPVQYQLRLKLDYASSLLLHTAMTVSSVAMECGFSSDAQFCSLFKRERGETPKQHRTRLGSEKIKS